VSINGSCSANPTTCVTVKSDREIDITIPATIPTADPNNPFKPLSAPHKFALDVINGNGVQSNAVDFIVVQQVDLSNVCPNVTTTNTMPSSVAIADQIADGPFSPFALVSVTGCNSVVVIDLNPASPTFGQRITSPVTVGTNPQGIAIWQHKGLAVVANNGSNTATVLDLTPLPNNPPKSALTADVSTGTNPTGVAINDATGAAIVANTGSNTVTMINLGLLFPQPNASPSTPPTTLTPISIGGIPEPIAVAIDPDRGTSNQGIAVVTTVQPSNGSASTGALAVVEIGQATPALSTTISSGFVSSTPTGIVFDPAVATNTTNPGVFFANSSGTNVITEFNPDSGGGSSVNVGINPTSLAINPQTGAILTSNSASNTISVVDTLSNPFKTQKTFGLPGSPTFGVAIDQFTNLAVIVDQAHQRVLLFPMPN
jgi:DNA-binding beta-propeller fold protein YncE